MAAPESGLEVRDRMWLKITIPNAFLGVAGLWASGGGGRGRAAEGITIFYSSCLFRQLKRRENSLQETFIKFTETKMFLGLDYTANSPGFSTRVYKDRNCMSNCQHLCGFM